MNMLFNGQLIFFLFGISSTIIDDELQRTLYTSKELLELLGFGSSHNENENDNNSKHMW